MDKRIQRNVRQHGKLGPAHKVCAFCGKGVGQRFNKGNWAIVTNTWDGSWWIAHNDCYTSWYDGFEEV
jgi:hypothetical protein